MTKDKISILYICVFQILERKMEELPRSGVVKLLLFDTDTPLTLPHHIYCQFI